MPGITFNNVLERALEIVGKKRSGHLRDAVISSFAVDSFCHDRKKTFERSFDEITRHELDGRRVVAVGNDVAGACKRLGIKYRAVVHPSARRRSNEDKAMALAAVIRG
jgi:hypothetical protein